MIVSFGVFSCSSECFSQCTTTLLAITRFLKIVCPFIRLKKKLIAAYLGFYTFIMSINNIILALLFHIVNDDFPINLRMMEVLSVSCFWLKVSHCLLGVIFSIITVIYIFCFKPRSPTDNVTRKVCRNILLMNIIHSGTILSALLRLIPDFSGVDMFYLRFYSVFLHFYFISIITSAWNPLVMLIGSPPIRQTFVSVVLKLKFAIVPEPEA